MTTFRELRDQRDFTALWVGQTISALGSHVSLFVLPLVGYAVTGSVGLAALAETLYLSGLAGALLPAGLLADRLDRVRIMRAASAAGVVAYVSLVAAGATHHLTFAHLCGAALVTGVCEGLAGPAETAAVRAVVPREQLPTAMSQLQARQHIAALSGGPVGGALYAVARWLPFLFDAVSYLACYVVLGRVRADLSAPAESIPTRALDGLREGYAFLRARPFFRVLLVWAPLSNLTINAVFTVAILRLVQDGVAPLAIGLISTAAGVAGVLGAAVAPRMIERVPTGWLTVLAGWAFTPLLLPMLVWHGPWVVGAALALGVFVNPAGNAGIGSYRVAVTPPELQGRVQSALQLTAMAALPFSAALGGLALQTLGGTGAIAALALACGLVALIPTCSRAVRSVPRPSGWPDEIASSTVPAATS